MLARFEYQVSLSVSVHACNSIHTAPQPAFLKSDTEAITTVLTLHHLVNIYYYLSGFMGMFSVFHNASVFSSFS